METCFNYSFEISLKPTSLEILENPSLSNEDGSQEEKDHVNCNIVLSKCFGEMVGIVLYTLVLFFFCVTSVDTYTYGKPWTVVIEFIVCVFLNEIKSVPF